LEKRRSSIQTAAMTLVTANADNEDGSTATDAEDSDSGIGLSSTTLDTVVEYATSYAAANGLQVQFSLSSTKSSSSASTTETKQQQKQYIAAPVSLLPQAYPALLFNHAITLACPFGILVDRVSRDGHFLQTTLKQTRQVDIFTNQLLVLYEEIYMDNSGRSSGSGGGGGERKDMEYGKYAKMADRLGILRSDYMLHRTAATKSSSSDEKEEEEESCHNNNNNNYYTLKQVELNTIASSFAGLSSTVAKMHSYLTRRMMLIEYDDDDDDDNNRMGGGELTQFLNRNINAVMMGVSSSDSSEVVVDNGVPESPAMTAIPKAISVAYNRYCTRFITTTPATPAVPTVAIVLFIVQPNETNTVDQRMLEYALWEKHHIPVVRLTLSQVFDCITLDEGNGRLLYTTSNNCGGSTTTTSTSTGKQQEVAVVYYRAGYAPTDYPSGLDGVEWSARVKLERGRATKCPNLGYHLAGTKKVQQELAKKGVLEHFFSLTNDEEVETVKLLRSAFAGLYSLDATTADNTDMNAVKDILLYGKESQYVLKPQREGGGYNFYGMDMANKLRENCNIIGEEEDKEIVLGPALSEFILMERLFPPQQNAILLRNGKVEGYGMTISELGCFGTIVTSGDEGDVKVEGGGGNEEEGKIIHNEYAGFLLRTKFSGVDEGGVASGFATLSSPYLC
jgi:glutathione synthase